MIKNETPKQREQRWTKYAAKALLGKRIEQVRYLDANEMDALGWYSRGLVLQLGDGTLIYPSQDDEGNNAGVIDARSKSPQEKHTLFPTLAATSSSKPSVEPSILQEARQCLKGRVVTSVSYLSESEMNRLGWYQRCLIIGLDNGTQLLMQQDEEGNNAGALFGQGPSPEYEHYVFPVLQ